jgi:hypothetical protein
MADAEAGNSGTDAGGVRFEFYFADRFDVGGDGAIEAGDFYLFGNLDEALELGLGLFFGDVNFEDNVVEHFLVGDFFADAKALDVRAVAPGFIFFVGGEGFGRRLRGGVHHHGAGGLDIDGNGGAAAFGEHVEGFEENGFFGHSRSGVEG